MTETIMMRTSVCKRRQQQQPLFLSIWILLLFHSFAGSAWTPPTKRTKQNFETTRFQRTPPPTTFTTTTLYSSLENAILGTSISSDSNVVNAFGELLSLSPNKYKVIHALAVDYGERKTGLAASHGGYNPRPLDIIIEKTNDELISTILHYCHQEKGSNNHECCSHLHILIGLPYHKDGTENRQTQIVREFAQNVTSSAIRTFGPTTTKVLLWDERYTSQEAAARVLNKSNKNVKENNLYGTLDADAACILLEDYFSFLSRSKMDSSEEGSGEVVELDEDTYNECIQIYKETQAREMAMKEAERAKRLSIDTDPAERRRKSIERTKLLEEQMKANGMKLGLSQKNKRKRKKKKKKP